MCVLSKTLCSPTQKRLQMGIFDFSQKETGAKSVSMATNHGVILFFYVMYISGAKIKEHCFNISGDIL